jgi:hypothetical protein
LADDTNRHDNPGFVEPDEVIVKMTSKGPKVDHRRDTRGTELYESLTKESNPKRVDKTGDKVEFGFWFKVGRFFRRRKIKK